MLVNSPNTPSGWIGSDQALSSEDISHLSSRNASLCTITCCFSGCSLTGGWNWEPSWNLNPGTLLWDVRVPAVPLGLMPAPSIMLPTPAGTFYIPISKAHICQHLLFPFHFCLLKRQGREGKFPFADPLLRFPHWWRLG